MRSEVLRQSIEIRSRTLFDIEIGLGVLHPFHTKLFPFRVVGLRVILIQRSCPNHCDWRLASWLLFAVNGTVEALLILRVIVIDHGLCQPIQIIKPF